jgi:quercetin dioxygenase-like cupin family protein
MLKRLRLTVVALALGALGVLIYGSAVQAETEPPPPVAVEVLTPRAVFTDDVAMELRLKVDGQGTEAIKTSDASRIVTTKVTVQPGAQIAWHTHPGPVFVTIVQGELTYVSSEDCVGRRYAVESAFLDPGHGHVHTAYNSGTTVTQFLATFFEVPKDGAISIQAEKPTGCQIPTG